MEGRTTGLANKLYGVNDIYETIVDYETRLPLKSIRNIKEGDYRWYNETMYYHDIDSINSQKSGWRSVPDNLVDIISVFFYFINHYLDDGMQQGLKVTMPTFHADEIKDYSIMYMGDKPLKPETVKSFAIYLRPTLIREKSLKRSDGLKFYVSKETKLPVLLEFDMRVGSLRAEMQSYEVDGKEQAFK
jgi:hypothetical protein